MTLKWGGKNVRHQRPPTNFWSSRANLVTHHNQIKMLMLRMCKLCLCWIVEKINDLAEKREPRLILWRTQHWIVIENITKHPRNGRCDTDSREKKNVKTYNCHLQSSPDTEDHTNKIELNFGHIRRWKNLNRISSFNMLSNWNHLNYSWNKKEILFFHHFGPIKQLIILKSSK